jgi:hypothetical protein
MPVRAYFFGDLRKSQRDTCPGSQGRMPSGSLTEAVRHALGNGSFEESEDEAPAIVVEFYPEKDGASAHGASSEADAGSQSIFPRDGLRLCRLLLACLA